LAAGRRPSKINFEASVKEINNRCPEETLAALAGKRPSDVGGGRGLRMSLTGVYLAIGAARFKVGKPRRGDANEEPLAAGKRPSQIILRRV
jgi:hypothetical protein